MPAPFSRLGAEGYGVRRYGSFSGKTQTAGGGPHPVSIITRLGEGGYGVRRYGSFTGKVATSHIVVGYTGGSGRQYRYSTSYNRDRQKWDYLLEEIRDDEAVPSKAKTAIAAVRKAEAIAVEVVEARDLETEQAVKLAELYESARSASKAVEAIARAKEAIAYAQELMDEEDEEDILMLMALIN